VSNELVPVQTKAIVKKKARTKKPTLNFSMLSADVSYEYAAADAMCTRFIPENPDLHRGNEFVVGLDNEVERVLMFLEEMPVPVDLEYANKMSEYQTEEVDKLRNQLFEIGGKFNPNSPPQLAQVLTRLNVPLTHRSEKSGNLSTNKKILQGFVKEHPIVSLLFKYRNMLKGLNTYIKPFVDGGKDHCFLRYNTYVVPTGRFSSGGKNKPGYGTPFFLPVNIQSVTKPKAALYSFELSDDADSILGYKFTLAPKDVVPGTEIELVEGCEPTNIRRIVRAHPDQYVVSIDYKAEEIVIAANLSNDQAFLKPLIAGLDPHKETAIAMFGAEVYSKDKRKLAKANNFGQLYLGTEKMLIEQLPELSWEEATEIISLWRRVHYQYIDYMDQQAEIARACGYISSLMGRVRPVGFYFDVDEGFARRTVANHQVQGLAADILRYVLVRVFYDLFRNQDYSSRCRFLSMVHDEINFSVTKNYREFTEIATITGKLMTTLPFGWSLPNNKPLEVDFSVGDSWGNLFPFKLVGERWIPKSDRFVFKDGKWQEKDRE
jgi:DNA polymerase-1